MISSLLNHLWQSTLFAAMVWLLTLLLKRNAARTRYWLWLAASVKFLIPFSLLVNAGSLMSWKRDASPNPVALAAVEQVFVGPALAIETRPATQSRANRIPELVATVWLAGFLIVMGAWWRQWRRALSALRNAVPIPIQAPIPVMTSATLFEPGVFGIVRPVLLLPEGISQRLSPEHLRAILAHELCHVRCHDNLAAASHMLTEALFWFHPLAWWVGARMVDERERACDEEVLRQGSDPQVYAEGILKVCTLYLESPMTCVAGVTGSNLRRRIGAIMTNRAAEKMGMARKLVVVMAGALAVVAPVMIGVVNAPQMRAQTPKAFDVASVKMGDVKRRPEVRTTPTGIEYIRYSLRMLIGDAYDIKSVSISAPDNQLKNLLDREFFDITAKTDHPVSRTDMNLMLQTLLADRFKMKLHHESKIESVYKLSVAASGVKFVESSGQGESQCQMRVDGGAKCSNMTMAAYTNFLTGRLNRIVVDATGLTGRYDFDLKLEGLPVSDQIRDAVATGNPDVIGNAKRKMGDWTETSIFSDLPKQLGLKLESDRAPVDNLIIDHAERPTAN